MRADVVMGRLYRDRFASEVLSLVVSVRQLHGQTVVTTLDLGTARLFNRSRFSLELFDEPMFENEGERW